MLLNNTVSALVGVVPFAGDILLAQFKANWRNAALLEEFLRIRGEVYLEMKAEGKDVAQIGGPKPLGKGKPKGKGKNETKDKPKDETKAKGADEPKDKGTDEPRDKVTEKEKDGDGDPAKKDQEVKRDAQGSKEAAVVEGKVNPDVEQIKPGAGLREGEVIPDEELLKIPPADETASMNESVPASETAPTNKAAVPTSETVQRKRKMSFPSWRGKLKGTQAGSGKGKFVENLPGESENGGGVNGPEASTSGT
jgi:hypothetical protein